MNRRSTVPGGPAVMSELAEVVDRGARLLRGFGVAFLVVLAVVLVLVFMAKRHGRVIDARWVFGAVLLSGVFGPVCLSAGIGLKVRREWARKLAVGIAWTGIPVFVALAALLHFAILKAVDAFGPASGPWKTAATWVVVVLLYGLAFVVPMAVIVFSRIRHVTRLLTSEYVKTLFSGER